MTYTEYREKQRNAVNALPLFFAFSDEQLEKALAERGLTTSEEDCKKVCEIPGVGFCLVSDLPKIEAYFADDSITELMKDPTFAEEAFLYEMNNHEYCINGQGDWDVCSCFFPCEYAYGKIGPDYLKENGCAEEIIDAYKRARHTHIQNFDC